MYWSEGRGPPGARGSRHEQMREGGGRGRRGLKEERDINQSNTLHSFLSLARPTHSKHRGKKGGRDRNGTGGSNRGGFVLAAGWRNLGKRPLSPLSPCFVFGQKVERAKKEKRKREKARRGNGQKLAVGTAAVQRERQSRERTGRMTSERACMDGNVRGERRAE